MDVAVQVRVARGAVDRASLRSLARSAAREALAGAEWPKEGEVSVVFVADDEIRQLNARYRGVDRPTDVLAFALSEGDAADIDAEVLGDVVVSVDAARRQARRRRHSLRAELALLVVHGTLHLVGFDHDAAAATRRMRRVERECLQRLEDRAII